MSTDIDAMFSGAQREGAPEDQEAAAIEAADRELAVAREKTEELPKEPEKTFWARARHRPATGRHRKKRVVETGLKACTKAKRRKYTKIMQRKAKRRFEFATARADVKPRKE